MSTTVVQRLYSPSNKQEEDTFRLHKPSGYSTPSREPKCSPSSSGRRLQEEPKSSSKKMSKAEKLALREKARVAMTPPFNNGNNRGLKTADIQPKAQRTSLSLAVAMTIATSPTMSSFPDEFWAPFVEQDEYDRNKMFIKKAVRQEAKAVKISTPVTVHRSNKVPGKVILSLFQWFLAACFQMACILFLFSLWDVPYFRPIFEGLVELGQLIVGLSWWLHICITDLVRASSH